MLRAAPRLPRGHALRSPASFVPTLFAGLLLLLGPGCASSSGGGASPAEGPEGAFVPLPIEASQVSRLLLELDKTLLAWQQASDENNQVAMRKLESILRSETIDSFDEVVQGLESAAPGLRQTAAAALGFSGRAEALSPLSNALDDPDDKVRANALIGLGKLADPASPVSTIAYLLRTADDPFERSNAAYALARIVAADLADPAPSLLRGRAHSDVLEACRQGLYDDFAGVRSQCASVLGLLVDDESIEDLGLLVHDDEDLAAKPAILALGDIGEGKPRVLGEVARSLAGALGSVQRNRRTWVRSQLVRLAQRDFEGDTSAWREWAYSLP